MLSKKGWIISGVYLLGIVLLPPLLEWTDVSRRDSSVIEFVREFTNLVPLRGIMGTVGAVLETGRVVYLTNYAVQLLFNKAHTVIGCHGYRYFHFPSPPT